MARTRRFRPTPWPSIRARRFRLKQSLAELNEQKAEKFLTTFYFQYGHRSIADLAHVAMAIERLSLLAATLVVDETRWDGQERSTRYQDFRKSGHYMPEFSDPADRLLYEETIEFLFAEYRKFSELNFQYLVAQTAKPREMTQEAYERTLRARAFDISRYLLPLATNTSLGQIVNARTLETQVSRLLGSPYEEVRRLGERMKAGRARSRLGRECRKAPWHWLRQSPRKTRPWGSGPGRSCCARPASLPR